MYVCGRCDILWGEGVMMVSDDVMMASDDDDVMM